MRFNCRSIFTLFIGLSLNVFSVKANRSDTVDIHHTLIHLDITDMAGKNIKGWSELRFSPKVANVKHLNLDLLKLQVDSIVMNNNALVYQYNDTLLHVTLGGTYGVTDTLSMQVYYHGIPQIDHSNWGGFYFQPGYAFNLGVGFDADPHSYGRVWFPCFDNFTERSTFTFEIITSGSYKSYCNGELTNQSVVSGDTVMRTWEMNESIPSYLACVAIADYAEVKWQYAGLQKSIPVLLTVNQADTIKLKNSFIHLNDAIAAFETAYGPYRFNKVGYSVVPFGGGAMEHASNITYPNFAVNGNTNYETLMAHELSHHWWGDLVTCATAEEMWINEGMASYSAQIFLEKVYGRQRYLEEVKSNHLAVIQYAHITEDGYRAILGVPHEYTYGKHVYDKGAVVAHNLRTYLGDSLFYDGLGQFLDEHQFSAVSSMQLRDKLTQYTGINMQPFFTDWVFGPGFPHFSIDSFKIASTPNSVDIFIHQKKRGSNHFYTAVPLTLTLYDASANPTHFKIKVNGEFDKITVSTSIVPVLAELNVDDGLNMAVTTDQTMIKAPGTLDFVNGKLKLNVQHITDSALFRVEHHWAAADPAAGFTISDYRYWRISGFFDGKMAANASIFFDARNITAGGAGNLDNDLLANGTDSVLLLYRRDASENWKEYKYYSKMVFGTLKYGRMDIDSVLPGEYAFANGISTLNITEMTRLQHHFTIAPNPASDHLKITDPLRDTTSRQLIIYSSTGREVYKETFRSEVEINTSKWKSGSYFACIFQQERMIFAGQFILSK